MSQTRGQQFLAELEAEITASRKCVERIPESLYEYKPHEKSMKLGYLTLLVAEIPLWLYHIIEHHEVNFATFQHRDPKTTAEMVAYADDSVAKAKEALNKLKDEDMGAEFLLKAGDQVLAKDTVGGSISSTIRHWVHHRGQLTVYMRLNNIPVPSIYGPTADDKTF